MVRRSRFFGGTKYAYSENTISKKRAQEIAAMYRKEGHRVRVVPLRRPDRKTPTSYDIYVRWKK